MSIREVYSPILPDELHVDIINYILKRKPFCVNGEYGVGKTSIVITTLKNLNFEVNYINEYEDNLENSIKNSNNVLSFFSKKEQVIVMDDYPFNYYDKHKFIIYIKTNSNKITNSFNIIIKKPSLSFLYNLAINVIFLEGKTFDFVPNNDNFITFWSDLEMSLANNRQVNSEYFFKPSKIDHLLYDKNVSIEEKIYNIEYINSSSYIREKIIGKITNLDDMVSALDYISSSSVILNTCSYKIMSIVAPSIYIK